MKRFLSEILPSIRRLDKRLDDTAALINRHWVEIRDDDKIVRMFFQNSNAFRVSINGIITRGTWEYLGDNKIGDKGI